MPSALRKVIDTLFSHQSKHAPVSKDSKGRAVADSDLRDYEYVPLTETIEDYFQREVHPFWPDAWISDKDRDMKDGQVGVVGYEINFSRYFYIPKKATPLSEINDQIALSQKRIMDILARLSLTPAPAPGADLSVLDADKA